MKVDHAVKNKPSGKLENNRPGKNSDKNTAREKILVKMPSGQNFGKTTVRSKFQK